MSKKYYITTTLPYVNGKPHLGHALEFTQADVLARFYRMLDYDVLFNYGTDEYGAKIVKKAKEEGLPVQKFVDKYAKYYEKDFKKKFNLSANSFIRTSSKANHAAGIEFWKRAQKKGDIYKKKYKGLYCIGCEAFKTEKDLVKGKCPDHQKAPVEIEEENYFFRFSKYQKALLDLFREKNDFVIPKSRHNEMIEFIKKGLEDFSISREKEKLAWGVPVPGDDSQVMYVWFEALTSYVAALGFPTNLKNFKSWWPPLQLCGPDNTRFQSLMWQAMLMSAELPPSKQILVHGTILNNGQKMSKSLGNGIDPKNIIDEYGIDCLRYFLTAEAPATQDVDVTWDRIKDRYNSDLANGYGNLVARVFSLAKKYKIEKIKVTPHCEIAAGLLAMRLNVVRVLKEHYDFFGAINLIQTQIKTIDAYLAKNKPWESVCKNKEEIISDCLEGIKEITILLWPFMPNICQKVLQNFEIKNTAKLKFENKELWLKGEFKPKKNFQALFPRKI